MKTELTCITCPLGCSLSIEREADGSLTVSGNRCPRGIRYANEELLSPKRMVTATVRVLSGSGAGHDRLASELMHERLPVRTSAACPKELVPELLQELYKLTVNLPVRRGDALLSNWRGLGIDVLASRTLG